MRALVLMIAVALICALAGRAGQAQKNATPKEVLHNWAVALSEGNVDQMVAFYEDSKDVLAIQSTGRLRKGVAEIRKEYEAAFGEVVFEKTTLVDLTVRESGGVAWASCELRANTVRNSDSTKWTLRVYTCFVLKLSGEKWRIVLEQSTPIAGIPRVELRQQERLNAVAPN